MAEIPAQEPTDPLLPEWDASEGPPLPTDVAVADAVEVEDVGTVDWDSFFEEPDVAEPAPVDVAEPAPVDVGTVDWDSFFEEPQPTTVRVEGPRKIVVEPAHSFNSITELGNVEDIAAALPERLPEQPTPEEMAYYKPYIASDEEFVNDREEMLYQWNRTTDPAERLELLEPWARKYMPGALERAEEDSGFSWGPAVRGLAWAAAAFDNVTARPARTLVRTLSHYVENPLEDDPSEEDFARVLQKSWDESHGDFEEGEDILKKIYKMGRLGGQILVPGGKEGQERLDALNAETDEVFQMGADAVNWLGYTLGKGSLLMNVGQGIKPEQWDLAREEAKAEGSVGGHEFLGFVGQVLVDPLMFFKLPSLKNFGGVDMTDDGMKALDELRDAAVARDIESATSAMLKKGERVTDEVIETIRARAYENATAELKVKVVNAADVAQSQGVIPKWRKTPQIFGVKSVDLLTRLQDPVYKHVVDDILEKSGVKIPDKISLRGEDGLVEAGTNYISRGQVAWAQVMKESFRRKQIFDGIDMKYKGRSVETLEDVFDGAIRWVDPPTPTPGRLQRLVRGGKPLTKEEAFKAQGMFHSLDNLRTRMMMGVIKRFPYLEPIRRTAESILMLPKAQPMAERVRKVYDEAAGDWRVMEQPTDVLSEGQVATSKWALKPGIMHQAKFRKFEQREMQRSGSRVVDGQKLNEFMAKVLKINDSDDVRNLALLFKGLGRHEPVSEQIITGVARVRSIEETLQKAIDGQLDELPPELRTELEELATVGEFADAAVHMGKQLAEAYSQAKDVRKAGLKQIKSNLNMLEEGLRSALSDTYRKQLEFQAFTDSSHIVDRAMDFKAIRSELSDLLKNKRWVSEGDLKETLAMVDAWRGEVVSGIDRLTSNIPLGNSEEVFGRLKEEGILPAGRLEDWTAVRGRVREGLRDRAKKQFGAGDPRVDRESEMLMGILDSRAKSWARWNRVDPAWKDAWYQRAFHETDPVRYTTAGRFADEAAADAPLFSRFVDDGEVIDFAEAVGRIRTKKADELAKEAGELEARFKDLTEESMELARETLALANRMDVARRSLPDVEAREPVADRLMERLWRVQAREKAISDEIRGMRGRASEIEKGLEEISQGATKPVARTESPEFKAWFGDSKVVDDAGEPLVVYHGGYDVAGGSGIFRASKRGALGEGIYFGTDREGATYYAKEFLGDENIKAWDEIDPDAVFYPEGLKEWAIEDPEMRAPVEAALKDPPAPGTPLNVFGFDPKGPKPDWVPDVDANITEAYISLKNPLEISPARGEPADVAALERLGVSRDKALSISEKASEEYGYIGRQIKSRAQKQGYDGIVLRRAEDGSIGEIVVWNKSDIKSTQNVGTWSPDDPRILRARGTSKEPLAGVFFDEGKAVIGAFEKATFTEMVHEIGHIFRRDLPDSELEVAEGWIKGSLGDKALRSDGSWSVLAEETFAQGFVKWLNEGDLPEGIANQGALKRLFEEMKTWLKDVYYAVTGRGKEVSFDKTKPAKFQVEMSDDIKGVFERLLDADAVSKSPLAREFQEASKAMDAATGMAQIEAYVAYRAAAARMMKAAGMEDVDIDTTIKAALSGSPRDVARAKVVMEDAMRASAGRVADIAEPLPAPVFRSKGGAKKALVDELVQRLHVTPGDAVQLVDEGIDNILMNVSGKHGFAKNSWVNFKKNWEDVVAEGARQYINKHPHIKSKGTRLSEIGWDRRAKSAAADKFNAALADLGRGTSSAKALVDGTRALLKEAGMMDRFDADLIHRTLDISRSLPPRANRAAREAAVRDARMELRALGDEAKMVGSGQDPALREAAEIAALKGPEIAPSTLERAEEAVAWLTEQIVQSDREVKSIIMEARTKARTLAKADAARTLSGVRGQKDVEGALEAGLRGVQEGVAEAFSDGSRLRTVFGEHGEPKFLKQGFTEHMDELLEGLPGTSEELRRAASDLKWDLRSPGEVWEQILTYKKQARAFGDYAQLQREVALEAFKNDELAKVYGRMSDDTQRKVRRLLKDRRFYGVSADASPEVKRLAKEIGMVGEEELFVYTKGKRGEKKGGYKTVREAGFTDKDIKDALEIVKMLDNLFEGQLKRMQESGKFKEIDPQKALRVNQLVADRDVARTLADKRAIQARIDEIENAPDYFIKWSKEDFLDRVDVASYVPHVLKSVSRDAVQQLMGRGLLPSGRPIMFEKFRSRASILDDINETARNDLGVEILYHNAVNRDAPAWQEGGAFNGLNFDEVRDAALMGSLEKRFAGEAWDEAVKWARMEAGINDQFDFFETNFNIIVERYMRESDKAISDQNFINDIGEMFPMGKEIARLVDGTKTWNDAKAREYGYSRLSKADTIQALTGLKLPTELSSPAMQEWITQALTGIVKPDAPPSPMPKVEGKMSTGEVLAALRTRGINVDRTVVEAFKLKDQFMPTPAVEYLRWMNKSDPLSNSWFFGFYDGFHALAKGMATIASLAHINMNMFGNYASIAQQIGLDLFNPRHHLDAMAIMMRLGADDKKWFQKMGMKHEDALIKIGNYEFSVKEWRDRLADFGVTEAPLSQMMLDDIGSADRVIPGSASMWRSILGAGGGSISGAAVGSVFGGPVGAVAGGFLGQFAGSLAGEVSRYGWKKVWNDEVSDFIKSIEEFPSSKRGPKRAIRYFGERSVGMTIGAATGSVFGPPGAVAGAIAGLSVPSYMRMMAGLNQSVEMQARLTLAVAELSKGKSFSEAATSVDDALRNYSHLTPFERHVLRRVFFFYTWDAGNMRYQAHRLMKSPRQAAVFMHFMNGVFKGQFNDSEIQAMPEALRWRVMQKTGPMRTWSINGLPQQAFIENIGRSEGLTGMLSRGAPIPLMIFELMADKQSVYYGKGWEEINNVRQFENASPLMKWMVGFPVKKDEKTGKWIAAPQPAAIYDKDGNFVRHGDAYRSTRPIPYYIMTKLPGWRTIREQNSVLQSQFVSRVLSSGESGAEVSDLERAISFVSGHRAYDIDFNTSAVLAQGEYLKAILGQVETQNRALFYDITRANERLPVYGGPLEFPTKPEDTIEDLPVE